MYLSEQIFFISVWMCLPMNFAACKRRCLFSSNWCIADTFRPRANLFPTFFAEPARINLLGFLYPTVTYHNTKLSVSVHVHVEFNTQEKRKEAKTSNIALYHTTTPGDWLVVAKFKFLRAVPDITSQSGVFKPVAASDCLDLFAAGSCRC